MSSNLIDLLDFNTAWKRVKLDYDENRLFFTHPYEMKLINEDFDKWLDNYVSSLKNDSYEPSHMGICEVPKLGNTIRPGGLLTIEDHLFYTACVGAVFPDIYAKLKSNQNKIEFSYPLKDSVDWIEPYFEARTAFKDQSLATLSEFNVNFVVFTDITAYYENIDLRILNSRLNRISNFAHVTEKILWAQKIWSPVQTAGKGIPQGYAASDILGKLYLNSVDEHLKSMGYKHCRWVDDIRIFCSSEADARRAIVELSRLLREVGLNVQSAKTIILDIDDAAKKIVGVTPIIEEANDRFLNEIQEALNLDSFGGYLYQAEELLYNSGEDTPIEVIRRTYEEYFLADGHIILEVNFDKTLFRYLVKRLGNQQDNYALFSSLQYLKEIPSETETIVNYLSKLGAFNETEIQEYLAEFLSSEYAIYDYQIYEIFEALNRVDFSPWQPNGDLLQVARNITFDMNKPLYLRTVCRIFLCRHGSDTDIEKVYSQYTNIHSTLEQCEIIIAVKRMQPEVRNLFYSKVKKKSTLHSNAVKLVKENRI